MHGDGHIPASLRKATTTAQMLRWLLSRVSLSRLNEGIGRSVVQKVAEHWWSCEGSKLCSDSMTAILEQEGSRASGDHTYGVVRNLAAYDEEGMPHVLRASLFTVMGQGLVLGCKVNCSSLQGCSELSNISPQSDVLGLNRAHVCSCLFCLHMTAGRVSRFLPKPRTYTAGFIVLQSACTELRTDRPPLMSPKHVLLNTCFALHLWCMCCHGVGRHAGGAR